MELVVKYKITSTFLSSRYVADLVQNPRATCENLKSLKIIAYGGSALTETSFEKFSNMCGDEIEMSFAYGSTEVGPISHREGKHKPKSVGKLLNNVKIAIIDENGRHLSHNEVGEIMIKNSNFINGYFGNARESEKAFNKEGWFYTGDLGYMDEDNDLFIVDRKKEILKYKGIHYWPTEIEDIVSELPGIRDSCVVSIFDDTVGDVAGALVVPSEGSKLTEQDVVDHVKARLTASHKHLNAGAYFVDKLPQNFNGKIIRKDAKDLLKNLVLRK